MATLDPAAKQVLEAMAASGQPTLDQLPPAESRQAFTEALKMLGGPKLDADVQVREWQGPEQPLPLHVYRPVGAAKAAALPTVVYLHGGGWVIGDLENYDTLCRVLCAESGCQILSFQYRLAPEDKFPAAVDDACAAPAWTVEHAQELGVDVNRLAVAGDSAGGTLAAVAALTARDAGGPKFKHQLLIFPATDMAAESETYRSRAEGYFLTKTMMTWFINHYLRTPEDAKDWRASPARAASLANLPPATVVVAGFDPLYAEGVAYAEALKKAGNTAEVIRYDGMIHDFILMDGAIAEGRAALKKMAGVLRKALA